MQICIVCIANYCRSPVAEKILQKRFGLEFKITSAGIDPFPQAGMDIRSQEFLEKNNIPFSIHQPKKISNHIFEKSKIVFAMDQMVLMNLNNSFRRYKEKIKLFNYQSPKIKLTDPYKMGREEYFEIMESIKEISNNIKI